MSSLFQAFQEVILPREKPDIVEWLERNRTLTGAHSGPWRRDWCKWSLEIMRAAVDRTTRVIIVRGGSQCAKTESVILNVWAFRTVDDPRPTLMVLPTQLMARDFSHQRIGPLIDSCPALAAVVNARGQGRHVRDASTLSFRTYAGGFLKLTGTLSASELSQVAARDVFATELDRFSVETENGEGSPIHLMKLRQRTFEHTSKLIMECSPTIQEESRIQIEYLAGSQEHYFLPVRSAASNRNCSSLALTGRARFIDA